MESALLLLIGLSAAAGFVLRNTVSAKVGRRFLHSGTIALLAALGVVGVIVAGWSPVSIWTGGLTAALLLAAAAIMIAFGLGTAPRRK